VWFVLQENKNPILYQHDIFFLRFDSQTDNVRPTLTQGNLYLFNLTFQNEIKSQNQVCVYRCGILGLRPLKHKIEECSYRI
jgi:hypothetical protein